MIIRLVLVAFLLSFPLFGIASFEQGYEPWGPDSDLLSPHERPSLSPPQSFSQKACGSAIRFFQVYISPIDGPRSSYIPSSSQYTLLAIQKYGVLKGIALGCDRLMRENGDQWVYERAPHDEFDRKVDLVR